MIPPAWIWPPTGNRDGTCLFIRPLHAQIHVLSHPAIKLPGLGFDPSDPPLLGHELSTKFTDKTKKLPLPNVNTLLASPNHRSTLLCKWTYPDAAPMSSLCLCLGASSPHHQEPWMIAPTACSRVLPTAKWDPDMSPRWGCQPEAGLPSSQTSRHTEFLEGLLRSNLPESAIRSKLDPGLENSGDSLQGRLEL